MSKKPNNDIEAAERDYEEDQLREQLIKTQEILMSVAADQQRMRGQIDSMPKRLDETLDSFLKSLQSTPPMITSPTSGGWLSMIPEFAKILGIGGPSNTLDVQLQDMFQYQFKKTTLGLWTQAFKDINKKMGIPEHLDLSESVHLSTP